MVSGYDTADIELANHLVMAPMTRSRAQAEGTQPSDAGYVDYPSMKDAVRNISI